MGYRLHVAKKYDVVLGDHEAFNWKILEFHDLLSALDVDYTGEENDMEFEVDREQWEGAITTLQNIDKVEDANKRKQIEICVKDMAEDCFSIVNNMKILLEEADPRLSVLHLQFV